MKPTLKNKEIFIKGKLSTDKNWAIKALIRIFKENQTEDEKTREETSEDNGYGFTGTDAGFLSSLAKQFIEKGFLSEKQTEHVFKKMPKYWRQVMIFIDTENPDKLNKLVEDFENKA